MPQFKKRKRKEEAPNIKTSCTKAAPHSHPPPQAQLKPAGGPRQVGGCGSRGPAHERPQVDVSVRS